MKKKNHACLHSIYMNCLVRHCYTLYIMLLCIWVHHYFMSLPAWTTLETIFHCFMSFTCQESISHIWLFMCLFRNIRHHCLYIYNIFHELSIIILYIYEKDHVELTQRKNTTYTITELFVIYAITSIFTL